MDNSRLPRELWAEHPNYPQQTLLLQSHRGFLRLSEWIRDGVEQSASLAQAARKRRIARMGQLHGELIWSMRSHERYEEGKLYPYLACRYGASFDQLESEHQALHELDGEVRRAFARVAEATSEAELDAAAQQVADALAAHLAQLASHLRAEEDLVIPMLLELRPDEFAWYYRASAREARACGPRS